MIPDTFKKLRKPSGPTLNNKIQCNFHWYPSLFLTTRNLGRLGERVAAKFLLGLGHDVLAHNWRCRLGEIDLVTVHDRELVIVEVKTRRGAVAERYSPLSAIDDIKKEKLIRLSKLLWDRRGTMFPQRRFRNFRIDVVAVTTEPVFFLGYSIEIQYLPQVLSL